MSQDTIFSIDYSMCDSATSEIQSRINYLDKILELKDEIQKYITLSDITINVSMNEFNSDIHDEITRYTIFKSKFESFCEVVVGLDERLEISAQSRMSYINDEINNNYDFFRHEVSFKHSSMLEGTLVEILNSYGLNEKDFQNIEILLSEEGQDAINKYANMDISKLKEIIDNLLDDGGKTADEIKEKFKGNPAELILIDILCATDERTWGSVLNDLIKDEKLPAGNYIVNLLSKGYIGNATNTTLKDIKEYENLVKTFKDYEKHVIKSAKDKNISDKKLNRKKETLGKKKGKLDNNKTTKKVDKVKHGAEIGMTMWNLYAAIKPNYEDWRNGGELDDLVVNSAIDYGGIALGGAVGTFATNGIGKIGGMIGTAAGPVGIVVGYVVGFAVGGFIWYGYDKLIDPTLTYLYEEANIIGDKLCEDVNELGDWWDTLWW